MNLQIRHSKDLLLLVFSVLANHVEDLAFLPLFGHGLLLGGPVKDVPVGLIEELVVLVELFEAERVEMLFGERGEQEVGLEDASFPRLVHEPSAFLFDRLIRTRDRRQIRVGAVNVHLGRMADRQVRVGILFIP